MSDRPQAVRTGVRPDGALGADGTPRTGASPAGASPVGASAAGQQGPGGPSLAKPATGQVPVQAPGQFPGQAPPQAPGQIPGQAPGQAPGQVPADATVPPPSGNTQVVPPASVAPPAAGARTGQQAAGKGKGRGGRGPRRARLQLRHIDTWSALKISLVLSIALFFVWMVAIGILYGVLSGLGVFDTLNDLFGQLGTASDGEGGSNVITPGVVFGGAAVIGAINIVLMTALCTVAAFVYNLCADLVGGLEVTLAERD
ncbi:DUF3566 domain-containing protein [Geodermatophilus normandii]|uniref:DUF3566 domain-containing protein n=1 Tax=Geodermatophilus normandii TaxID=1137989 RepID=A0A6P0GJU0_9ACTN|nr:DUF3566 domain-containing protein [Geodermatophilus normandii]NEM07615.1 DUF3566 domain-containing protein [Geodermatophilus normandii]